MCGMLKAFDLKKKKNKKTYECPGSWHMIATDQSSPFFITWRTSSLESINSGNIKSHTASSMISEDRDWLVAIIADGVPTVLFQSELGKSDLKVRT